MRPMRKMGRDQGILTREEMKYVEQTIVEQIHEHLIGRDLFPLVRVPDAGYMDYKYYKEIDMGPASISRYGTSQSDDRTIYYSEEVVIPIIDKTFFIQRRDILASRHQGPSLLEQYPRNAARQIAEEEDKLLLTGEYAGWAALGISGLSRAAGLTGVNNTAGGVWPANAEANINAARIALENRGFIGTEGILIAPPGIMKCLDQQIGNTEITYRKFLEKNDLVRATYETRNLFNHGTGAADVALLVIPGKENFYMVEAEPPTVDWWYDKMKNAYGWIHEAVVPIIARNEAIQRITGLTSC